MKPIQFEVDETPFVSERDCEENFNFYICATNCVDDDFSEVINTLIKIWEIDSDVSLKVNIKLKDVYENLFDSYQIGGEIKKQEFKLFDLLRKDCQWIIDQINELETYE